MRKDNRNIPFYLSGQGAFISFRIFRRANCILHDGIPEEVRNYFPRDLDDRLERGEFYEGARVIWDARRERGTHTVPHTARY